MKNVLNLFASSMLDVDSGSGDCLVHPRRSLHIWKNPLIVVFVLLKGSSVEMPLSFAISLETS